jgi:phage-related protein
MFGSSHHWYDQAMSGAQGWAAIGVLLVFAGIIVQQMRNQVSDLRDNITTGLDSFRNEMRAGFDGLRGEMNGRFDAVDAKFSSINARLDQIEADVRGLKGEAHQS